MNIVIVFVKFLGWIVVIWMRLVRLIEEVGDLRFWKRGPTTKIKYIITKINKFWTGGGGGASPLGAHLGPSLSTNARRVQGFKIYVRERERERERDRRRRRRKGQA